MSQDLLATDAHNRKLALDAAQSFIVEAPAGAGKTELLTQRFLALLATVDNPEEVVALTFTKKAAAEMRHRVISSLKRAAAGQMGEAAHQQTTYRLGVEVLKRDSEHQWHLLEHAGRLQITTLDALCSKLARQMPLLSRLGSQPTVTLDAEPYYAQAALATLQSMEGEDGLSEAESKAVVRVASFFDNDAGKFQKLVVEMLASRDQWIHHTRSGLSMDALQQAMAFLVEQELGDLTADFKEPFQSSLMPIARHAASFVLTEQAAGEDVSKQALTMVLENWSQPLTAQLQNLPQWQAIAELLLTSVGDIRANAPSKRGFTGREGKGMRDQLMALLQNTAFATAAKKLHPVRMLPNPVYDEPETRLLEDLVVVLKLATAHLWTAFKQGNEVDFIEIAQRALEALGSSDAPSDLQLQMDYRVSHLLVDEFQDTSPTQIALLERLTAGWQPQDKRTLFLVGDPMQSIYKFRKADVGLFLKVRDQGLGSVQPIPLRLCRNNRSCQDIVDWGNQVFPKVFAQQDNHQRGAVRFNEAQATKASDPLGRVVWHAIIDQTPGNAREDEGDDDESIDPTNEQEAQAVVDIIRQAQAEDPKGTIAVLVRARTHVPSIVKALRAAEPPLLYQAVEIEPLSDRQVIQDLMSLTHALLHLGDRVHWLAILRAPWCGLLLEDLHRLAADDQASTVWALMQDDVRVHQLSEDGQARLKHVREVLSESFAHHGRQRLRRWVEGTWHNLGGPMCLNGAADLLDTKAYFDTLDQLEDSGTVDLTRLQAEVSELYAAPDPKAPNGLQIMTLHSSKGLEFDTVILPGLQRMPKSNNKKMLLWDEVIGKDDQEHLVVASIPHSSNDEKESPTKFGLLNRFEAERTLHETQRLLYVAATRTKRQLHLLASAKPEPDKTKGPFKAPAKGSFMNLLWPVAEPIFVEKWERLQQAAMPTDQTPSGATTLQHADFNHQLVRLSKAQRPEVWLNPPTPPIKATEHADERTEPPQRAAGQLAADTGTLVHKYLELMARDGLQGWNSERVKQLEAPMRRWLRQQGHTHDRATQATQETVRQLTVTLASEAGLWVLAPHSEAGCEVSFTTHRNGLIQTHIIDRTFVDNGVRWIVDYKTTQQEDKPDVLQNHAEQLQRYRSLFAETDDVRCAILFTASGRLVTVQP